MLSGFPCCVLRDSIRCKFLSSRDSPRIWSFCHAALNRWQPSGIGSPVHRKDSTRRRGVCRGALRPPRGSACTSRTRKTICSRHCPICATVRAIHTTYHAADTWLVRSGTRSAMSWLNRSRSRRPVTSRKVSSRVPTEEPRSSTAASESGSGSTPLQNR